MVHIQNFPSQESPLNKLVYIICLSLFYSDNNTLVFHFSFPFSHSPSEILYFPKKLEMGDELGEEGRGRQRAVVEQISKRPPMKEKLVSHELQKGFFGRWKGVLTKKNQLTVTSSVLLRNSLLNFMVCFEFKPLSLYYLNTLPSRPLYLSYVSFH